MAQDRVGDARGRIVQPRRAIEFESPDRAAGQREQPLVASITASTGRSRFDVVGSVRSMLGKVRIHFVCPADDALREPTLR